MPLTAGARAQVEEVVPVQEEPEPQSRTWRDDLKAAAFPAFCAIFLRTAMQPPSPLLAMLWYLIFVGAGFMAVRILETRHGPVGEVAAGGRLGAITGLLCAAVSAVLNASVLMTQGKEAILAPLRENPQGLPIAPEAVEVLSEPGTFAAAVAIGLLIDTAIVTGLAAAGGALAAKLASGRSGLPADRPR